MIPITVSMLLGQIHIGARPPGAPTQGFHMQEIYQQLASLINIVVVPLVVNRVGITLFEDASTRRRDFEFGAFPD